MPGHMQGLESLDHGGAQGARALGDERIGLARKPRGPCPPCLGVALRFGRRRPGHNGSGALSQGLCLGADALLASCSVVAVRKRPQNDLHLGDRADREVVTVVASMSAMMGGLSAARSPSARRCGRGRRTAGDGRRAECQYRHHPSVASTHHSAPTLRCAVSLHGARLRLSAGRRSGRSSVIRASGLRWRHRKSGRLAPRVTARVAAQ